MKMLDFEGNARCKLSVGYFLGSLTYSHVLSNAIRMPKQPLADLLTENLI